MGILSHRLAFLLATQAVNPERMEIQDFYENADKDFILRWKKVAGETKLHSEVNAEEIARLVSDLGSLKDAASVLPRLNKNIIAEGTLAKYDYVKNVNVYQEGVPWSNISSEYIAWKRQIQNVDFLVNPSLVHALGSGEVKPNKLLFMKGVEEGPFRLFAEDKKDSKGSDADFGFQFERLVTCLAASSREKFEACMATGSKDKFARIRLFTFGNYTALVSNEIDAIDANGEVVEIKAGYRPNLEKGLKLGSQMLLAGAKKLIHSDSGDKQFVRGVKEYSVEEVLAWEGKDNKTWQTFHDNIGISLGKLQKAFLEGNNEDETLFFKLSQLKGDSVAVEVIPKCQVTDGFLKTSKRAMESKATVVHLRQLALKYVETGALNEEQELGAFAIEMRARLQSHGRRPDAVVKQSCRREKAFMFETNRSYNDVNGNSVNSSYGNGNNNYQSDWRGGGNGNNNDRYGARSGNDLSNRDNRLRGNRDRDSYNPYDSNAARDPKPYGARESHSPRDSYGSRESQGGRRNGGSSQSSGSWRSGSSSQNNDRNSFSSSSRSGDSGNWRRE